LALVERPLAGVSVSRRYRYIKEAGFPLNR
jgi:hypothetical protein